MKRNDFVTNVLKCNNFHCLASLRLVDLNIPVLYQSPVNAESSLPEASGFKYIDMRNCIHHIWSSLPEASGFKLLLAIVQIP